MKESAIIQQVLSGDRHAFRILVIRYQRPVFRFLNTFRLRPSQREEIAQETFLRAYKNLASFDPARGASFSSWLFTIAKNLAANELTRASHRAERLEGVLTEESVEIPEATEPLAQQVALENSERQSLLQRALSALPRVFRTAVVFAYIEELSLEEIAAIEDCSVGTVKSRIFRGKQLLREALAHLESLP